MSSTIDLTTTVAQAMEVRPMNGSGTESGGAPANTLDERGVAPNASPHASLDPKAVQDELMGSLRMKRGILNGKDLYRVYGEAKQEELRTAIRSLEEKNLVAVRGNLDSPLGVFESVLLEL